MHKLQRAINTRLIFCWFGDKDSDILHILILILLANNIKSSSSQHPLYLHPPYSPAFSDKYVRQCQLLLGFILTELFITFTKVKSYRCLMWAHSGIRQRIWERPHQLRLVRIIFIHVVDCHTQSQVLPLVIQMEHRDVLIAANTQTYPLTLGGHPYGI